MNEGMLLSERRHTARKQHGPCGWCAEAIESGEAYVVQATLFDALEQFKAHIECHEAIERSDQALPDGLEDIDWGVAHTRGVAVEEPENG